MVQVLTGSHSFIMQPAHYKSCFSGSRSLLSVLRNQTKKSKKNQNCSPGLEQPVGQFSAQNVKVRASSNVRLMAAHL